MKHETGIYIRIVLVTIIWCFFLFLQHLACFDVFDSNSLHLYVLAILFGFIHCALIYYLSKQTSSKLLLCVLGCVYVLLSLVKLSQITFRNNYKYYHIGLTITCLALDALGALISFHGLTKVDQLDL